MRDPDPLDCLPADEIRVDTFSQGVFPFARYSVRVTHLPSGLTGESGLEHSHRDAREAAVEALLKKATERQLRRWLVQATKEDPR